MAGFLSAYSGTTRVQIDDHYWVDLKLYVSQGGQEQAEKALLKMVTVNGVPESRPDVASYRKHLVHAALDDWNLDDENGQVFPLSLQSIQRLPIPVFNLLWTTVQENNSETKRSPEEQIDFRK